MSSEIEPPGRFRVPSRRALLLIAITVAACVVALAPEVVHELRERRIRENEIAASRALGEISREQLRRIGGLGGDPRDYWLDDVSGLCRAGGGISSAIAKADVAPLVPLVTVPIPHHGYFFVAARPEEGGEVSYQICAFPEEYGVTGRVTYLFRSYKLWGCNNGGERVDHWLPDDELIYWGTID